MAAANLLALIDDIATVLDDVSLMTKVAAQKTAGVLGDDLALNAQQVSGVTADRELPVVWAVAKGSLVNKLILVPAALALSAFAPFLVTPLLMLGGLYLCFEGFEKLAHRWLHAGRGDAPGADDAVHAADLRAALSDPAVDFVALEGEKIKGAIRTDFVLSAEIIAITLGTVAAASFLQQVVVLSGIAVVMTIGVYGLVAGIVKIDDAGLHLSRRAGPGAWRRCQRALGQGLLTAAPRLMKTLAVVGTVAMFLVGGGILTHGLGGVHHGLARVSERLGEVPAVGGLLSIVGPSALDALFGMVAGAATLALVRPLQTAWARHAARPPAP